MSQLSFAGRESNLSAAAVVLGPGPPRTVRGDPRCVGGSTQSVDSNANLTPRRDALTDTPGSVKYRGAPMTHSSRQRKVWEFWAHLPPATRGGADPVLGTCGLCPAWPHRLSPRALRGLTDLPSPAAHRGHSSSWPLQ